MLSITVDDREQAGGLPDAIRAVLGHAPKVRRLEVGDVTIGERYVVERKEAADFVASILDGRLDRQVNALLQLPHPVRPMIVIEGGFNKFVLGGMAPERVRQAILSLMLDHRLPVLRTREVMHTAQWIVALATHEASPEHAVDLPFDPKSIPGGAAPASHRSQNRPPKRSPEALQLAALRKVPGLGEAKARILLEEMGSIHAVKTSPPDQLEKIPGIGPSLARAIHQTLNT